MPLPVTIAAHNDTGIFKEQSAPTLSFLETLDSPHLIEVRGRLLRVAEGMHCGEIVFISHTSSCMWHSVICLECEYPVGRVNAASRIVGVIGKFLREDIADPDHDASG